MTIQLCVLLSFLDEWIWLRIGSRPNYYFDGETLQTVAATMGRLRNHDATAAPVGVKVRRGCRVLVFAGGGF